MTSFEFIAQTAWKGTMILGAAFAANAILRRRPAALRHFIWTAAFVALLLLPVATLLTPKWALRAVPVPLHASAQSIPVSVTAMPAPPQSPDWLLILWAIGCCAAASRFALGIARTSWILRRAATADYARELTGNLAGALGIRRRVRAVEGGNVPTPLQWGIARPVIMLPLDARDWPSARLKTVLLHELLHAQRFDLLAQAAAQAACCLYWFHPLAWLAARQLRQERERACDDAVLLHGVPPHEYAGDLMDLVRSLAARRARLPDAPAMASPSNLEIRVRELLDRGRNRSLLNRRAIMAVAAAAIMVLLPAATLSLRAQAAQGSLAGVVSDPTGGRVPYCTVSARNLDGANEENTQTDESGAYNFPALSPGHYAMTFSAAGFARFTLNANVTAGVPVEIDSVLAVGSITQVITVSHSGRLEAAAPPVKSNVQAAKLVRQIRPVYPTDLQNSGLQVTVSLAATLSASGILTNLRVLSTSVDPRFAHAALDAARQWRYQPTTINGQPVDTPTSIDVNFQ